MINFQLTNLHLHHGLLGSSAEPTGPGELAQGPRVRTI